MSDRVLMALAAVLVVGITLVVWSKSGDRPAGTGGPFSLVDARTGKPFTDRDLAGKPAALFFGFTHCPDVCPTALVTASEWLKALGPQAAALRFVFVTVDPERDTPDQMARYLQAFDPRIVGLTGSRAEVDAMIEAYGVFAEKRPGSGEAYSYDHTALIFLVDARGELVGSLDFEQPQDVALARLRELIAQ